MGKKEKRDRSRSKDRKRKKHKRSRSSSTSSSDTSNIKHKKHKKEKKNKSKDNNLPSIDDIIAQKLQEKRGGGERGQTTNAKVEEGNIKSGMKPMTKAEYDQKQSVVRRVFDEDTGRTRLVKGEFHVYKLARNITIMVTFFIFFNR